MITLQEPTIDAYTVDPDVEKVLKQKIKEIDNLCAQHRIPYFFSAAIANDNEGTKYENTCRSALPFGIALTDDRITTYLKVYRGCEVVFPESLPDMSMLLGDEILSDNIVPDSD